MKEEEEKKVSTATDQEVVAETEAETPAETEAPAMPEFVEEEGEDEGEEEDAVGWYVKLSSDPDQPHILKHPEGMTHEDVVESFFKAKAKKNRGFRLGMAVLDPDDVVVFGWSESIDLPAMEAFDGIQERMEFTCDALADLARQQAALQAAQAELYKDDLEDLEDLQAEAEEALRPEVLEPGPAPAGTKAVQVAQPTSGRKAFRPPGA